MRIASPVATLVITLLAATPAVAAEPVWMGKTPCTGPSTLTTSPLRLDPYPLQPAGYSKYIGYFPVFVHPTNWSVGAGEVIRVHIFLSGMDALMPAPHPARPAGDLLAVRLALVIRDDVWAESNWQAEPGGRTVAGYSERVLTKEDLAPGTHEFALQATVEREIALSRGQHAPHLGIEVRLSGATAADDRPVVVHRGEPNASSWAHVPGMPLAEFSAMEQFWHETGTCDLPPLRRDATDEPNGPRESPLGWGAPFFVGVALLLVGARRPRGPR